MSFNETNEENLYINSYSDNFLKPILDAIEDLNPNSSIKNLLFENNIVLGALQAPASILHNCNISAKPNFRLVGIDLGICKNLHEFDTYEIGATLLHELGHVFNPLQNKQKLEDELAAMPPLNPIRFASLEEFMLTKDRSDEIKSIIKYQEEYNADDFAIKFNYGRHILSSLRKMLKTAVYSDGEQKSLLEKRIGRLVSREN